MRSLSIALLPVWLVSTAYAGDPGTTSANFLKIGIGPRAIAMGEAQTGVADDVYATYWNPAGLTQLNVPEAGFVHTQYFQDITEQYVAYAHPVEKIGTFAGSLTYLNVGKFDGYDATGQPTASVGANDMAVSFAYARALWQDRRAGSAFSMGGNVKYLRETLDTVSASAYATDLGAFFEPGRRWGSFWEGWRAGATIRNLGTAIRFDQDSFVLPRSLNAGLSWTGLWLGESLTLAADMQQPNDGKRTLSTGLELWTLRTVVLRAGYTNRGDLGNGLRVGAGLRFKAIQVDYAFAAAGELGNSHRIGITFHFGQAPANSEALAERWYRQGLR
jgi:hypothetical protein